MHLHVGEGGEHVHVDVGVVGGQDGEPGQLAAGPGPTEGRQTLIMPRIDVLLTFHTGTTKSNLFMLIELLAHVDISD